ncbi:MAG TPA: DUF4129 domain-containing protein [Chloroflexota bacterium]|nr:DUF4129 domain-containing protein [Chloroflexota bacterium]
MTSEDQALDALHAILSRPEFQTNESRPWWEQLLAPVFEWLFRVLTQLWVTVMGAATGREGWLGLVVLLIAGALLVAVLLYLVRSVRLAVVGEAALRAESLAERRERSDQLWARAQQLATAGDWPAAVRAAYLSALYALDEHAILHVQSGLTNREHALQLAREHPEYGDTFAELVQRYDHLRYGRDPVTADAFANLSQLVARARSAAA